MMGHSAATAPRWREGRAESSARAGRSAAPCPKSRACTIRGAASCKGLAGAAGED
jgi:hypothetical protein